MSGYLAIFFTRIQALFQYRMAALAGMLTQAFWGLIYTMVLTAFYRDNPQSGPISLEVAISFVWINQAFWLLVPWNVEKQIEAQIRTGTIAYELVRPLDLYWVWFYRSLAFRIVPTLCRSLPIFVLAGLFFGLQAPASWQAFICFLLSVSLATVLSACITTLVLTTLFWTISGEGLLRLLPHVAIFFAGLVVPIPFFPEWLQPFMLAQPFRAITDIPCRFYTGMIHWHYFAIQIGWTFFFIVVGRLLMKKAMNKVIIQGG